MKKIVYVCDCCGEVIKKPLCSAYMTEYEITYRGIIMKRRREKIDLCDECQAILKNIKRKNHE